MEINNKMGVSKQRGRWVKVITLETGKRQSLQLMVFFYIIKNKLK